MSVSALRPTALSGPWKQHAYTSVALQEAANIVCVHLSKTCSTCQRDPSPTLSFLLEIWSVMIASRGGLVEVGSQARSLAVANVCRL